METVGIIGLGEIGWRMGKLLIAAGHPVVGYDISPPASKRAAGDGVAIAGSVADLCQRSDIIITCVTDGAALRDVVMGDDGVVASLQPGTPLIDTTSAEPWITREVVSSLSERGIPFLDAPVSGGVPAAEQGKMNFMVGGEAALIERCSPLLKRLGPVIMHVGPVGAGHTIKAINMLALASSMVATAELATAGRHAGIPLETMIARLEAGIGASYSTRVHFPRYIVSGNYASGFSFDLMLKDLTIGAGIADQAALPLFMVRTTLELYRVAANTNLHGSDNTRLIEQILGESSPDRPDDRPHEDIQNFEIVAAWFNAVIGAEAICLGVASGLTPRTVIDVLSAGSGESRSLSNDLADYLYADSPDTCRSLAEVSAAFRPVMARAQAAAVPASLLAQAAFVHAAAVRRFGDAADSRCVLDLLAAWTGQGERLSRFKESGS